MALTRSSVMTQTGKKSSENAFLVTISNDDNLKVQGVTKNPFSFKLNAKFADLFSGLVPGAELLQKTGDASLTTGIFSQKYYQGGNNLDMQVEFRIYDKGTTSENPVIQTARTLGKLMVSSPFDLANGNNAVATIGKTFDEALSVGGKFLKGEGSVKDVEGVLTTFSSGINSRVVTLDIHGIFRCTKMLITDLQVTHSPAQTHSGPLYGDFSVTLISLQAITQGTGAYGIDNILHSRGGSRVTEDGKTEAQLTEEKAQGEK